MSRCRGKQVLSRRDAEAKAREMLGRRLYHDYLPVAYRCGRCQGWHWGHRRARVAVTPYALPGLAA